MIVLLSVLYFIIVCFEVFVGGLMVSKLMIVVE